MFNLYISSSLIKTICSTFCKKRFFNFMIRNLRSFIFRKFNFVIRIKKILYMFATH